MKKSELLKLTLKDFDNWRDDKIHHLCNRIYGAAHNLNPNDCYVAEDLQDWIAKHLKSFARSYMTVDRWLHEGCAQAIGYSYCSEEMMEYRRLWLIDMIAYWESVGE